jgi:hypothetical protein
MMPAVVKSVVTLVCGLIGAFVFGTVWVGHADLQELPIDPILGGLWPSLIGFAVCGGLGYWYAAKEVDAK